MVVTTINGGNQIEGFGHSLQAKHIIRGKALGEKDSDLYLSLMMFLFVGILTETISSHQATVQ